MILSLIAAMARNRVIGRDGRIPWDLPEDRRRFREITMGHPVIMGRKTFAGIGHPLPGRVTIVVTRQAEYRAEGCLVMPSLPAALTACADAAEVFVCGGADLYREALPLADRLYLTLLHKNVSGDTYFPPFDAAPFAEISRVDGTSPYHVTYLVLARHIAT